MRDRKWVKDYLSFNRSDRVAVVILISLIILLLFIPHFFRDNLHSRTPVPADTAWIASFSRITDQLHDTATENPGVSDLYYDRPADERHTITLFYFDPNTIDKDGWKKLGLRDKTIQTILNYRDKGGRFARPEDLSRIYGLKNEDYERLRPYIRIAGQAANTNTQEQPIFRGTTGNHSSPRFTIIDINLADTTAFIALPGIGSKLAARIVSFRDKLGGFYRIEQVGETFGLADSIFQKIRPYLKNEAAVIRKININTATLEQLKTHPYIRYAIAKTIIAYRDEHGSFTALDELMKITTINKELFDKIVSYLEL